MVNLGIRVVFLTGSIEKYNHVSLKKLLQQGISELEFYGDLVYTFRKLVGNSIFRNNSESLLTVIKNAYNLDIMRQTACLVNVPITVES